MEIEFHKYHGTGNDFIIIDDRLSRFPFEDTELIARMCHRRFGIGADGLILVRKHEEHGYEMKYANSDGKESTMCGNGGRCFAAFVKAKESRYKSGEVKFTAIDGLHEAIVKQNGRVSLRMKDVKAIEIIDETNYLLNTGSPHYVRLEENLKNLDVVAEGRKVRNSERFATEGVNVNFMVEHLTKAEQAQIDFTKIIQSFQDQIQARTYERGVEDETLSCGTGAVACALVKILLAERHGHQEKRGVLVRTPGGELIVSAKMPQSGIFTDVFLEGPTQLVFKAKIKLEQFYDIL